MAVLLQACQVSINMYAQLPFNCFLLLCLFIWEADMSNGFKSTEYGALFSCQFCGADNMRWAEIAPGKWMPFDVSKQAIHYCGEGKQPTRDEVIQCLLNMGFEAYVPRTSTWQHAFIASNESQTIYFLIGKRSIDFKIYDYVRDTRVDSRGRLFTDGGQMVRNYYYKSNVVVHELILKIASHLVNNLPVDESMRKGNGKSCKEQKADRFGIVPDDKDHSGRNEMIEVYNAISSGNGGDEYLCDGMWISTDGSLHDKGR